jgi:hypothetical protein
MRGPGDTKRRLQRKLMFKALHGAVNSTEKAVHIGFSGVRKAIGYLEARDAGAAAAPVEPSSPPEDESPSQ